MRDLEIRGAGELLGAEQSGHVAAVGFELYVELLQEAVAELSGQRRPAPRPVRVEARVDAYVPSSYIPSEALKIDLHRRISLAESEDELRELQAATEDRFGPIPEPVEHLFQIQEAKLKLARMGADYLVVRGGQATVGPLVLGSEELGDLRRRVDTAIYRTTTREVSLRAPSGQDGSGFGRALSLVDAILASRQAA
jgi:transcription-repair coupling factor (superfamily II helicase)